jgi:transposase-like protein
MRHRSRRHNTDRREDEMAQRDPSTQERWIAQVQAWRSSGKALSAWAREHGVSHYALRYWKRRAEGKTRSVGKPKTSKSQAPKFVAVSADSPPLGAPIELLVGAVRVAVPAGFDPHTLAAVLAVLQQRC